MRIKILGLLVFSMFVTGGIPSLPMPSQTVAKAESQDFVCKGSFLADEKDVRQWNQLGADLKIGTPYWFVTEIEENTTEAPFTLIKWCDGQKEQEQAI